MIQFKFLFIAPIFVFMKPYSSHIIFGVLWDRFHIFVWDVSFHFRQKKFDLWVCFFTIFPKISSFPYHIIVSLIALLNCWFELNRVTLHLTQYFLNFAFERGEIFQITLSKFIFLLFFQFPFNSFTHVIWRFLTKVSLILAHGWLTLFMSPSTMFLFILLSFWGGLLVVFLWEQYLLEHSLIQIWENLPSHLMLRSLREFVHYVSMRVQVLLLSHQNLRLVVFEIHVNIYQLTCNQVRPLYPTFS